jgi:hypothetical protein
MEWGAPVPWVPNSVRCLWVSEPTEDRSRQTDDMTLIEQRLKPIFIWRRPTQLISHLFQEGSTPLSSTYGDGLGAWAPLITQKGGIWYNIGFQRGIKRTLR